MTVTSSNFQLTLVAGEASGDLLGASLLQGLQQYYPQAIVQGIGGAQMQAQGLQSWWSSNELAVRGYAEVIKHLYRILQIRKHLIQRCLQTKPDIFIGIDAPDFNLTVEQKLKQQGIKTIHFVSPSIWAWRPQRIEKIKRSADHVLCLFPFEPEIYHKQNIAATFVGHPLADQIAFEPNTEQAKQELGFTSEQSLIALLPGSVGLEIKNLTPLFLQTAQLLLQHNSQLQFVLPTFPHWQAYIAQQIAQHNLQQQVKLTINNSRQVLTACDATLIASGTATLEAALLKKPMVIAYKVNRLTAALVKSKLLLPWVGLPNILCQEMVVPELLQDAASAPALAQEIINSLQAATAIKLKQRFQTLHLALKRDTASLAAQVVKNMLEGRCNN